MKDSYSFDLGPEGLDQSYTLHSQAYQAIFDRCGLEYVIVEAESGAMGGSESEEFMVKSEAGEDVVVTCSCGYAANLQRAVSQITEVSDEEGDLSPQEIHTKGTKNDSGGVGLFENSNHPPDQVTGLHCRGSTPSVFAERGSSTQ